MQTELIQLKDAYEVGNMSPDEIALDRKLDVACVKAGLMQCSSKYRKDCGREDVAEDRLNFTDEQLESVNERIYRLALGAESEELQFKASQYIRDDKKGRKEVVKAVATQTFNILSFNENMRAVREQAEIAKRMAIEA